MPDELPARRTRRLVFGILALLVAGAIAANVAYEYSRTPRITLAIISNNSDPYWDSIIKGANDAAVHLDVNLIVFRSLPGPIAQSLQIEDVMSRGAQGIAISPRDPVAQAGALNQTADRTILMTLESDAPNSKRTLFVGTDDYTAGLWAAQQVRQAVPDGGEVMITVGSVDIGTGRERRHGVMDNLLDRGFNRNSPIEPVDASPKGKRYSIVATVTHENDVAKAGPALIEAIKAHPDVKCIVGLYGYSAPEALKALTATGKLGQVKIIGFDDMDETRAGIKNGTVFSSILQDRYQCGYQAIWFLADLVRRNDHKGPEGLRTFYTGIKVLDATNIDMDAPQHVIAHATTTQAIAPAN